MILYMEGTERYLKLKEIKKPHPFSLTKISAIRNFGSGMILSWNLSAHLHFSEIKKFVFFIFFRKMTGY